MRSLERKYNLTSSFYFLDQGVKHQDAYYNFEEPRIQELFRYLQREGCEVGLHGPTRSYDNFSIAKASYDRLARVSTHVISGNRQHRLLWRHPETMKIIHQIGLRYDTSLGFAAHEGFRNSYCLPFRLFDFQRDAMIDVWEFPLLVMDVTLFAYQRYSLEEAMKKCRELVDEVSKFNGLYTLLWHNSFFDEIAYPGITGFYESLLEMIASYQPESILGRELANSLE
jgi:hypothetical protein